MAKRKKKTGALGVYTNLANKRRTKKDRTARARAEYLASLPKHPVKRTLYRLHPKRVAAFWFSKRGLITGLKVFGVATLIGVLIVGGVFAYYRKELDAIRPGKIAERVQTTVTKYYDRNDVLLWEDKGEGNYWLTVDYEDISDHMKQATIAIEDRDFYNHDGISFSGIARSLFNNAQGGSVQGGSTLTQQLVKQVFLADEAHKRGLDGVPRKIKEVILSIEVERMYNKDEILALYLNESPYGGRRNGVESAAQTYFKKPAAKLTLAESAMLAAIPNQPGLYDPYNVAGHEALVARQHRTLDAMVEMKFITQAEADTAKKVPIIDTVRPMVDQLTDIKAPHFVLMVRSQLENELGKAVVGRGGLSVKTSLDYRIQKKLEESMRTMFASGTPEFAGFTNGAATVEDVKTGQVVAMMGSRDFQYPGFGQDNAATAFIQPGSTIKPFVYAELLTNHGSESQNFGSGSILADDRSMNEIYGAPLRNADGNFMGSINIRKGLGLSRNVPAVKAMYIAGVQETLDTIRALGNDKYCTQGQEVQAGLAASIGGCGTRQVDHVNAFASLARMGVYKPTSTVLEVKNGQGEVLKKYKESSKEVLDPQVAYIINDILSDDEARAGLYGRNFYGLVTPGVRTAVKTGTSDKDGKAKDIWTASYSPALSMAVWLGNSDTRTLTNANSSLPARIIGDVMSYAHLQVYAKDKKWSPGDWFKRPSGIQEIRGELFPSWYNQQQAQTNDKLTFDRVSKKLATDCTPSGARVEVGVTTLVDPVTKKKISFANDGYNPNEKDDVHDCDDRPPRASIRIGNKVNVNWYRGDFPLRHVSVTINGSEVYNRSVSSNGSIELDFDSDGDEPVRVEVRVSDEGYYTGSASRTQTP